MVKTPKYYKAKNGIEVIGLIEGFNLNFSLGNVTRAGKKTDNVRKCPVCGSELTHYDGVYRCKQCGWRR